MEVFLPLLIAIIPAIFLVRYFYLQDKNKPEPVGLIIKIFIIGILSVVPLIFIEMAVSNLLSSIDYYSNNIISSFCQAFIVAGFCEEFIKLLIVMKFAYTSVYFDETMDGIVYTIVASLGFACIENILYVIEGGLPVALLRGVSAVPLHAVSSGIMGYFIGKSKFSKSNSRFLIVKGLIIAIFIHGSYNFVLFISPFYGSMFSLLIFPILFFSYRKLHFYISNAVEEDLIERI